MQKNPKTMMFDKVVVMRLSENPVLPCQNRLILFGGEKGGKKFRVFWG